MHIHIFVSTLEGKHIHSPRATTWHWKASTTTSSSQIIRSCSLSHVPLLVLYPLTRVRRKKAPTSATSLVGVKLIHQLRLRAEHQDLLVHPLEPLHLDHLWSPGHEEAEVGIWFHRLVYLLQRFSCGWDMFRQ